MKKARKAIFIWLLSVLLTFILGCSSEPKVTESETITLTALAAWQEDAIWVDGLRMLQERVKEKSGGKLVIDFVGGPEAVSTFEQIEAVTQGTVDLLYSTPTFYPGQFPEGTVIKLAERAPWEQRENGAYDFINKLYQEKTNTFYLGQFPYGVPFHVHTNVKVEKIEDFKGLRIRVAPDLDLFMKTLGAAPTVIPPPEIYTAMERGLVDGYTFPFGIKDYGWQEVTKYVIDPGFYMVDVTLLMNLDAWKKLPEDMQKILQEVSIKLERDVTQYFHDSKEKDRKTLVEEGIEVITLSPEDSKKFVETANEVVWTKYYKDFPDIARKMKEFLTK